MKRYNIEATDENVLNSIKNNTLNRADDVKDFINILENIEGNMFIGLEAKWGNGKTFYVRQIEKTLEYHTKKKWTENQYQELEPYFEKSILKEISLNYSYIPIYYNAWLYDNHNDPLLSLIFSIVKDIRKDIDTKIDCKKLNDTILSIFSKISLHLPFSPIEIKQELTGKDILEEIQTVEEVREKVKEVLDEVITEEAQRLVIFIDELDRCRPNFAIEMLERIKHYFDDDRIIFVISINKEELIHIVSKYYGEEFDSSDYLNRFFDFTMQLPPVETEFYFKNLGIYCNGNEWIEKIAFELQQYYGFSLRNSSKFFHKINSITSKYNECRNDRIGNIFVYVIVPIICALDLIDIEEKQRLTNGLSEEFLRKTIPELKNCVKLIPTMAERYFYISESEEKQNLFEEGLEEFIELYKFVFKNGNMNEWYRRGDITRSFKRECIRISNLI